MGLGRSVTVPTKDMETPSTHLLLLDLFNLVVPCQLDEAKTPEIGVIEYTKVIA